MALRVRFLLPGRPFVAMMPDQNLARKRVEVRKIHTNWQTGIFLWAACFFATLPPDFIHRLGPRLENLENENESYDTFVSLVIQTFIKWSHFIIFLLRWHHNRFRIMEFWMHMCGKYDNLKPHNSLFFLVIFLKTNHLWWNEKIELVRIFFQKYDF